MSPSSLWTPVTTVFPCPLTRGGNSFALFPLFIPFNPAHISWNVSSVYHCSISKLLFLPIWWYLVILFCISDIVNKTGHFSCNHFMPVFCYVQTFSNILTTVNKTWIISDTLCISLTFFIISSFRLHFTYICTYRLLRILISLCKIILSIRALFFI